MTYTDIKVAEIMTKNILVAHEGASFTEICRLFFEMHFHHLPVLNGAGELMGIISSNDLLQVMSQRMLLKKGVNTKDLNDNIGLEEMMTKDPIVVDAEATVEEAALLLRKHQIHSLPVVRDGKVSGIVTSTDLVKCFTDNY
jgi:CBS domain-containing membrane protein